MTWIELAPHHKTGLPISSPLMPAAGVFGYGECYRDLIDDEALGALVTNPVSLRPRTAARAPRIAVHGETFVVHTGLPNPGLKRVLRHYSAAWTRQPLPVIVHLIATTPAEVAESCTQISTTQGVAGIELGLDDGTSPEGAASLIAAAHSTSELPLITRLPFEGVERLASAAIQAGTDALTLTAPPRAAVPLPTEAEEEIHCLSGRLYGRALFPLLLHRLHTWVPRLSVPVIACGGIATAGEIEACLAVGAVAVQIDALLWQEPGIMGKYKLLKVQEDL